MTTSTSDLNLPAGVIEKPIKAPMPSTGGKK